MNNMRIMGRLTKDPEIRYSQDNKPIANFTLADNVRNDKTLFINCSCFSEKRATFIQQYLTKGMKVVVNGRLEPNDYTDKNGQTVHSTVLVVNEIEFAESKPAGTSNAPQQTPQTQGTPFAQPGQFQPFAQPGQFQQQGAMQQPVSTGQGMPASQQTSQTQGTPFAQPGQFQQQGAMQQPAPAGQAPDALPFGALSLPFN